MEFIPLKKCKKSKKAETIEENKPKKLNKRDKTEEKLEKKGKKKPQSKIIEKKMVKSKCKETVTKRKFLQKAVNKKKSERKKEVNIEEKEVQEDVNEGSDEDQEQSEANEDAYEDEEEAFKRKCNEMDEKKKNRLFIKLKKKILNEMQIKELHPDIRSVIFPRKKNTRWCWAVFASQEKATKAMKNLIKNKDVIVSKPTPYEKVERKRKEKMKTILQKKQAKKKLQELWM